MYYHLLEELVATNGLSEAVSVHHRMGVELVRTGVQWDVVMCDVVSPQGTLHPAVLEELQTIRYTVCDCSSDNFGPTCTMVKS